MLVYKQHRNIAGRDVVIPYCIDEPKRLGLPAYVMPRNEAPICVRGMTTQAGMTKKMSRVARTLGKLNQRSAHSMEW